MSDKRKRALIITSVAILLACIAMFLVSCNYLVGGFFNSRNSSESNAGNDNSTLADINNNSPTTDTDDKNNNSVGNTDSSSNGHGQVNDTNSSWTSIPPIYDNDYEVEMDFSLLDARYSRVTSPIFENIRYIFNDVVGQGLIDISNYPNYRITGMRYAYGCSLWIEFESDVYVFDDVDSVAGDKSEFLSARYAVNFENFTESYCENYLQFRNFLRAIKEYGDLRTAYNINSMAKRVAYNLLQDYLNYDDSNEISILNFGKHISIGKDGSLSEAYNLILNKFNEALALQQNITSYPYYIEMTYAPLTDEDIYIDLGGRREDGVVYHVIQIVAHRAMHEYMFEFEFSEYDFYDDWNWLFAFTGSTAPGYTPINPNWMNPTNEEFEEFFERLNIADLDFSTAWFHSSKGEDTYLYF